jgi:hypothetical protein
VIVKVRRRTMDKWSGTKIPAGNAVPGQLIGDHPFGWSRIQRVRRDPLSGRINFWVVRPNRNEAPHWFTLQPEDTVYVR